MEDDRLISLKAAIDAIERNFCNTQRAIDAVKALPSAQPDHIADVSKKVSYSCGHENDLVSRAAAIDAIKTWGLLDGLSEGQAIEILADEEKLPSAQPERVCVANITLTDEQVKKAVEKAKNAIISVIEPEQRWIPVTLETLPNPSSVVVVCGKKGTWDYGTYRGWYGDIHSWRWKNNTIKHVYWWMYKTDALPEPYREDGEQERLFRMFAV